MTLALNFIASSGSEVEWSRTLMVAWLAIVLALSVIEVFLLTDGFSSRTLHKVTTSCSDHLKRFRRRM
jgi:hypothetical protein